MTLRVASPVGRPKRRPYSRFVMQLPIGYLRILDSEARALAVGRGHLLTLLMLGRLGEAVLVMRRGQDAPRYEVPEHELSDKGTLIWEVPDALRGVVTRQRVLLGLGNVPPAAFVIALVRDWLGDALTIVR